MPIHDQEVTPSDGGEGTNDEHKSGQVQNYPLPQSVADSWYQNLKTSLKTLEKVFSSDSLPSEENAAAAAPVVEKPRADRDYEREILETKLTVEMLGKTKIVGGSGREVEMHVAWAEEMERLVLEARLESGTMYLREVRDGLPGIVRDGLPVGEEYESWMGFLDAVKGISATYIKEKMEGG